MKVQDTAGFLQEQEIHHESASRGRSEFEYCVLVVVHAKKQPNSIVSLEISLGIFVFANFTSHLLLCSRMQVNAIIFAGYFFNT